MDAEIPDADILKVYRAVAAAADGPVYILARRDMDRMIAEERERCAKIAEEYWTERPLDGRDIAAAIRS